MRRSSRWILAVATALCGLASVAHAATMVAQSQAARHGLTRAWYAQVGSPRSTGPISHVHYHAGIVLVQTTQGMLTGLDAETGRTLWSTQVGPRGRLCTEAAANDDYVAVANGSVLFVLDRARGEILWQKQVTGVPGAGPALTATHVFVPMITGLIEGYEFEKGAKQSPWKYNSAGRVLVPPLVTPQSLSWTTEKGYFFVASPEAQGIRYRLETRGAIQSRPGYWTPNLYACSTDGVVYALNEATGKIAWKYSVGDAIFTSPVAIEDKVFVTCELSGMICIDAKTAEQVWVSPRIAQFLAASPTRVYTCDKLGRLVVLDLKTGSRVGMMPLDEISIRLTNPRSDRVYLGSSNGVVQCLHEVALKSPVLHNPPKPELPELKAKLKEPGEKAVTPKADSADEAAEDPDAPAMEEDKPKAPAEGDDDPFADKP